MKKSEFRGWKDVFAFSVKQELQGKGFRSLTIIVFLIILLYSPIKTYFDMGEKEEQKDSQVGVVTIYNETGLPIDLEGFLPREGYPDTTIRVEQEGFDAHVERLAACTKEDENKEILIKATFNEAGNFNLLFVRPGASALEDDDRNGFRDAYLEYFAKAKLTAIEVTEEQLELVNRPVAVQTQKISAEGTAVETEETELISMNAYYVLLGIMMITMMIISFSGNNITMSIMTEKTTRVVEYLIINVRPLALLVGKVLSAICTTTIQFAIYGLAFLLGRTLSSALFEIETSEAASLLDVIGGFQPVQMILAILIVIVGILAFGILAGVLGARVSKMEELQESLKLFSFAMVIGAYLGIGSAIMGITSGSQNILTAISSYVPLSIPFAVPANLLAGNISVLTGVIALVIETVCAALLFLFAARVYEALIFYNGNIMKLKDIISIAKAKRAEVTGKEAQ